MMKLVVLTIAVSLFVFGCSAGKVTAEDMEALTQQVETVVKTFQDLGLDANAFAYMELGEDIGGWKTSLTGPLKVCVFVQATARPKKSE